MMSFTCKEGVGGTLPCDNDAADCSHCQRSGNQERTEAAERKRKSSLLRLTTHFQAATLQRRKQQAKASVKVMHKRITRLESVTNEFHPFMLDVK